MVTKRDCIISHQEPFRKWIMEKLAEAKSKNYRYSLRALAYKIGMSPGAVCNIIQRRRAVSDRIIQRSKDYFDKIEII